MKRFLLPLLLVTALCLGPGASARVGLDETVPVGVWPLVPKPEVVATFDPPEQAWGAGHRGVDLGGRIGQQVSAALPGTVSFRGVIAGKAVIVVDHGDTRTTYEPVASEMQRGAVVATGDPIGRLVLPGSHCFPRACLHWGWLRGETYLDPLLLVGGGPIRLLPLWQEAPSDSLPMVRAPASSWPVAPRWWFRPADAPGGTPRAIGPW